MGALGGRSLMGMREGPRGGVPASPPSDWYPGFGHLSVQQEPGGDHVRCIAGFPVSERDQVTREEGMNERGLWVWCGESGICLGAVVGAPGRTAGPGVVRQTQA